MLASYKGHGEVVQKLLAAGVNKEAANKVGCRGASHFVGLRAAVFMGHSSRREMLSRTDDE